MAEGLALASAVASLVTLVGQVSRLSYIFLSDIRNASRSQKLYLQETSALTEVLLRIEDALEVRDIEGIRNFVAFGPSSKLKSTLENCQDLLASLKISLEKAAEDGSQFARLRSSLKWPFGEKEIKKTVDTIKRHRLIPHSPLFFALKLIANQVTYWLQRCRPTLCKKRRNTLPLSSSNHLLAPFLSLHIGR